MKEINEEYQSYYLMSFEEEYEIISKLEQLGFNIGCRSGCDCGDPFRFEGKRISNIDSTEKAFQVAELLTNYIGLDVYLKIYQREDDASKRGLFFMIYFENHITKESELTNVEEYANRMYLRSRWAKLEI